MADAAQRIGLRTLSVKIDFAKFSQDAPLPAVLQWQGNHYVVVYKITKASVWIADPAHGLLRYSPAEFLARWIGPNATSTTREGIALLLEPTAAFYQRPDEEEERHLGWQLLAGPARRYRTYFLQLAVGLLAASL